MYSDLKVFNLAYAMATHAGKRQAVIARNMANSDTPGYRPGDIASFADSLESGLSGASMRASRATHLNGAGGGRPLWQEVAAKGPVGPNGNGVSLEEEMLKAVEAKRQHDRALAIYKSSLSVLRASLGKT